MLRSLHASISFICLAAAVPCGSVDAQERTMNGCTLYSGMCDASAAVTLDEATFVVADDESNVLRIYRADRSGGPFQEEPWDVHLGVDPAEDDPPEVDLEGAAVLGGRIYWISSHGRNKDGKWRPYRHRFFATEFRQVANRWILEPSGTPCTTLATQMAQAPKLRSLDLEKTLEPGDNKDKDLAPKDEGFNIEGLCAVPGEGTLLIALRNPRPRGKALLVPLLNPAAVLAEGEMPQFGDPILLDLSFDHAGRRIRPGVRSIVYAPRAGGYLIVAGPHDERKAFALFRWSGRPDDPPALLELPTAEINRLDAFAPEALIVYPESDRMQLLSDDGSRKVQVDSPAECEKGTFENGRCEAKRLLDPGRKTFRSLTLPLARFRS